MLGQHFVDPALPAPLIPRIRTLSVLPVLIFAAFARFAAGARQRGGGHGTVGDAARAGRAPPIKPHRPAHTTPRWSAPQRQLPRLCSSFDADHIPSLSGEASSAVTKALQTSDVVVPIFATRRWRTSMQFKVALQIALALAALGEAGTREVRGNIIRARAFGISL
jgi:hypothetical protein